MYSKAWRENFWNQSGSRYQIREETEEKKDAHYTVTSPENAGKRLPVCLSSLENRYGSVDFSRLEDGTVAVSFARKEEFSEPVWSEDRERLNLERVKKQEMGGGVKRLRMTDASGGAEAFLLPAERGVKQEISTVLSRLDEMAESMASLLLPLRREEMLPSGRTQLGFDLSRAARTAERKNRVKEKEKKKWERTLFLSRAETRKEETAPEDAPEDFPEELPEKRLEGFREELPEKPSEGSQEMNETVF